MKKIRVGIIFGGKSSEHEASLQSAKSVIEAIDKKKFVVILIGIDKNGHWAFYESRSYPLNENNSKTIKLGKPLRELQMNFSTSNVQIPVDVVFPILHGVNGEDGTVQGLLKLMNIPFVGAGVLGSAIGMNKDVSKRLLRDAKYIDANGTKPIYPAKLPKKVIKSVLDMAIKTYKVLETEGMARVDFFLTKEDKLYLNEINTIPGFTKISMHPKLWEVSGFPYPKLIEKLIKLAQGKEA
ncbi:MAG: hypothetical protein CO135_00890 [Candidatus Levybacteria bacterium CG_4_9_14_3_um_filter_35_16]|nr:MAG: hypothetical protein COW87_03890 [Candidatus Levybacteria bacterium CG22_combo_CG10-13_8_21_14_all_35_11]PIY94272.1 MAG: hypothetical protein COY68_03345 [Candidatus Levybacteria bacterium CG_4_10_14_0_8_um_filter_35_23]PJA91514.1 MAG: hypothetical protein CO135_00890 [Candidatus Levybacteria bacterium CG_4_9_14_3_um_filter_35_16]PJC54082.1 MAG: hypothetical protein CO028_04255 [Candidatus Levybacteria bacterium CG_4_9_14_0_2_um_filter_35_21]